MSLVRVITQGGPGGILLFLYLSGSCWIWMENWTRFILLFPAVVIAFLFPLLIELLSDITISFISYPVIKEVKKEIDEKTGSENFYFDHEEKQEKLDEYDNKVYRYTVLTYSGFFVAITLPIQGYFLKGVLGFFSGLGYAFIPLFLFSYLPFRKLRKIIKTSVKLYE